MRKSTRTKATEINFMIVEFKKIPSQFTGLIKKCPLIQARIAQLVAYRLGTGEVPGSNPGKGQFFRK